MARSLLFIIAIALSPGILFAQDATEQQETELQDVSTPKRDRFEEIFTEIQTSKSRINHLYATLTIGFPEVQQKQMAEIQSLKNKIRELESQAHRAAFEAYVESPNKYANVNQAMAIALNRSLNPRTEIEKFNPKFALEIAAEMIKNEVAGPPIYFTAFRAAFAIHDFELARNYLDKIAETSPESLQPFYKTLDGAAEKWKRELELREAEAASKTLPQVQFETTAGNFVVELYENEAPNTVANFLELVTSGYYNDNSFYFVEPGIRAVTGCPTGDGTSDPGYRIPCECEQENARHHFAGTLSMHNDGPGTGGAKFYISHQPNEQMDGKFTVFGRVIDNLDYVYQFETINNTVIIGKNEPSKIKRITVIRPSTRDTTVIKLPLDSDESSDANSTDNGG